MDIRGGKQAQIEALRSLIDTVDGGVFAQGLDRQERSIQEDARHQSGARHCAQKQPEQVAIEADEAPLTKAYQRILALCGYHEFSKAAMRKRLAREGFDHESIEWGLTKAEAIGALDDARWAEMRAYTLFGRGMGQIGIERELRENGVEALTIEGWPDMFASRYGAESDRAFELLEKAPPRAKNLRQAAYGKLIRKGYSSAIAREAVERWLDLQSDH